MILKIILLKNYITKQELCKTHIQMHILNVKMEEATQSGVDLVSAITLIGLQKNLIDKLGYITHEHPFRLSDFTLP